MPTPNMRPNYTSINLKTNGYVAHSKWCIHRHKIEMRYKCRITREDVHEIVAIILHICKAMNVGDSRCISYRHKTYCIIRWFYERTDESYSFLGQYFFAITMYLEHVKFQAERTIKCMIKMMTFCLVLEDRWVFVMCVTRL